MRLIRDSELLGGLQSQATNQIITSSTPVARTTPNATWSYVIWADGLDLFIAGSSANSVSCIITSPDGITWTARTTPNQSVNRLYYEPLRGIILATGASSTTAPAIMTSRDGITWAAATVPNATGSAAGIAYSQELGKFISTSTSSGPGALSSIDGSTWTNTGGGTLGYPIWCSELGIFVAHNNTALTTSGIYTSPDGITWTSRTTPTATVKQVAWSPEAGIFVAVYVDSGTGYRAMSSPDGISWTNRLTPTSTATGTYACVSWISELQIFLVNGNINVANAGFSSRDGINWNGSRPFGSQGISSFAFSPKLGMLAATQGSASATAITTSRIS
jgi:hypothetical protein